MPPNGSLKQTNDNFNGELERNIKDNKTHYEFHYQFANSENRCNIFEEYLIYDTMGMIGSVGGTMGMFIGFSMTGVISSAIGYLRKCVSDLKL